MTNKQIKDLVAHLEKNPKTAMIDGETAVKGMKAVTKVAYKLDIPWPRSGASL